MFTATPCTIIDQGQTDLTGYKVHTSLMSLPKILKTTLETIPAEIPYIQVPKTIPDILKLPDTQSLKIGFVWASSTGNTESYQKRSLPAALFFTAFQIYYKQKRLLCGVYK